MVFDLPLLTGVLAALGLSVLFVTSLYFWPQNFHRNHPTCVKQRMFSASIVTVLSPLYLYLFSSNHTDGPSLPEWIGVSDPLSAVLPLLLSILLFAGPLFQHWTTGECLLSDYDSFKDILLLRNLVLAPITEEIVYRGCMVPLLYSSLGWTATILTLPFFFGIAHLHHAYELRKNGAGIVKCLLNVLLQSTFTSAFGAYSTLVFLTTGSLVGPVLCHAFCNTMGFPAVSSISDTPRPLVTWAVYLLGLVGFLLTFPSLLVCKNFSSLYCQL